MLHHLGGHASLKLSHRSDLVTAVRAADDRIVAHALNDRETVLATLGAVEFDTHAIPTTRTRGLVVDYRCIFNSMR